MHQHDTPGVEFGPPVGQRPVVEVAAGGGMEPGAFGQEEVRTLGRTGGLNRTKLCRR